ncbi:hypothetical protein AOLI_G00016280 [Acnodon oligacanthus]
MESTLLVVVVAHWHPLSFPSPTLSVVSPLSVMLRISCRNSCALVDGEGVVQGGVGGIGKTSMNYSEL